MSRFATSSLHTTLFPPPDKRSKVSASYMVGGGSDGAKFLKLLDDKKGFLLMAFFNLIVQLGITYYIMMNYNYMTGSSKTPLSPMKYYFLLFLQIALILILALVPMPSWLKFLVFSVFSASLGAMLSYFRTGPYAVSDNLIQMAVSGTMSIFGVMFILGALLVMFGIKLGYSFALFLLCCLLFLVIGRLISMFMGAYSIMMRGVAVLSLVIFSIYIIYDTNHILQREYYGDFITASLDYYLDIINVFINLLSLNNN